MQQLQLFRAPAYGSWSDWEDCIYVPKWYCASESVNDYFAEMLLDPGDTEFDDFVVRIKTDPDGCRWFERYNYRE